MTLENGILYFWTAGCTVCEPLYEKLKLLMQTDFPQLSIEKIDTSTNPELRTRYQVFLRL